MVVSSASADANKTYLKDRLIKQPLYLRGMWVEDDLHFDEKGRLLTHAATTSFTLSGIEIRKLEIKDDHLQLTGRLVGLELDGASPKRVVLTLGTGILRKEEEMHIAIDHPASGDYSDALDAIFTAKLEDLAPSLPSWWRMYAAKELLHVPYTAPFHLGERPRDVGGDVTEPLVVKSVEPDFTPYAKALQYKGTVQVELTLGKDAKPVDFVVIKPLGLGLDEAAIEAIRAYVFGPATMHGKTVAARIAIETTYHIY
jgi:hypothetical protein